MNLRQLQFFVEVGNVQSITKAAARLNLAQPALTRHMRALERDLGVQLTTRSGRGIALTNAGLVLFDRAKGILRDIERARIEVEANASSSGGEISLGLPASISRTLTRRVIQYFKTQLPKMRVRVIDGWSGFIIEWLILGRLDVGVIYDFAHRSDMLGTAPLAAERQFLVCARDDPLARRRGPISLQTLTKLPLILPNRQHGLRLAVEQHMRGANLSPRVEQEIDSVIAIKQFVEAGGIYTILPPGEAEHEVSSGSLVMLPLRPAFERTLSIAWSKERAMDKSIQPLLAIVQQETAQLVESGLWGTTFLGSSRDAAAGGRAAFTDASKLEVGSMHNNSEIDSRRK
ncbi:MAG: LysR family transcriptional regulator [Hyphomicrobiaceae bacterium]